MHKIAVLAVGPGSPAYLVPAVRERAVQCDLLVGGRRNLELFRDLGVEKIELGRDFAGLLARVGRRRATCRIGILLSGDSGIYSLLPRLREEFGEDALEVYPGISAVQYLFARLGRSWQEADFFSLHGREAADLVFDLAGSALAVIFTAGADCPARICRVLSGAGLVDRRVYIGEDLSYETEKIRVGSPQDFLDYRGSALNLVVIANA